jgi:hypothetical protein
MRALLVASTLATASMAAADAHEGAPKAQTRVGYLGSNGRCPGFGITFADKAEADPLAKDRICVTFSALEGLPIPDEAKREAFKAMVGKKVTVTFTSLASGTMQVTAIALAK